MLVGSLSSAWELHRNSPNLEDNTEDFKDSLKGSQRLSQPNRTVCTGNDLNPWVVGEKNRIVGGE